MTDFIKCPFCCGHEAVSREAAHIIKEAIALHLHRWRETLPDSVVCELENICNVIENTEQREPTVYEAELAERYTPPICPTPTKQRYHTREHALPNAVKWRQHAYECPCGYWHLSKQSIGEHHAKINSPAASPEEFESIDPLLL